MIAAQDLYGWDLAEEPNDLSIRVVETRNYVRTWRRLEEAKDDPDADIEESPMVALVEEIGLEAIHELVSAEMKSIRESMQS